MVPALAIAVGVAACSGALLIKRWQAQAPRRRNATALQAFAQKQGWSPKEKARVLSAAGELEG